MTGIAFVVIVVVYVAIAAGVTYGLVKLGTTPGTKRAIAMGSLSVFFALAVWDEVWGYVYLRHLCASEGGIKVYKTVTLGPEHWNEGGLPRFISFEAGGMFKPFLDGRYQITGTGKTMSGWPQISRSDYAVVDLLTKEQLAVRTTFFADHGWLLEAPGGQISRRTCPPTNDVDYKLVASAFRKSPPK